MTTEEPDRTDAASVAAARVVLQRIARTKTFEELGLLVREDVAGRAYHYRTSDGSTSKVGRAGILKLERGSVMHVLRTDPGEFCRAVVEHPVDVLGQLVRERGKDGTSAAEAKELLHDAGLSSDVAADLWGSFQKQAKALGFVREGMKYLHLDAGPIDRAIVQWVSIPVYENDEQTPQLTDEPADGTEAPEGGRDQDTGKDAKKPAPPSRHKTPLLAALAELGTFPQSHDQLIAEFLPIATHLAAKSPLRDPEVKLTAAESDLWWLIKVTADPASNSDASTRKDRARERRRLARRALASAIGTVEQADAEQLHDLAPAMWNLISATVLDGDAAAHHTPALVAIASGTAKVPLSKKYTPVFEALVEILANRIAGSAPGEVIDSLLASPGFDIAVGKLPIESRPRIRILRAIHQYRKAAVIDERWWAGFTARTMSAVFASPLRKVLVDEEVVPTVVLPRLSELVEGCQSRSDLAVLFTLPDEVVSHVQPSQFQGALARTAQNDAVAAAWMRQLTHTTDTDRLRQEVERLTTELAAQRAVQQEIKDALSLMESSRDRALEDARSARTSSAAGVEARDRQARVKVLRSLADVAAAISVSSARDDGLLSQRVASVLDREGMGVIGAVDSVVAYRPAAHDAQGQLIKPGEPAIVVRPGYNLREGSKTQTLVKARVTAKE